MRSALVLAFSLAGIVLSGCASTTAPPAQTHSEPAAAEESPIRYGVELLDRGRTGATYSSSAREHVIHRGSAYKRSLALSDESASEKMAAERPAKTDEETSTKDARSEVMEQTAIEALAVAREMQAWERWCDAGAGMTKADYALIADQGFHNVPASLADDCLPPK